MKKLQFSHKIKNVKLAFALLILVFLVLLFLYYIFIISTNNNRIAFANEMIEFSDQNEDTIFNIQKILLYSDAHVVDNSENRSLKNIDISQYTDLSIYIDNSQSGSDLTDKNTIKNLYIDNISITCKNEVGKKILNYKKPLDFGKYTEIEQPSNNRIDFKIINTNDENNNSSYEEPTFYTDCSNPITLGFLNKNLLTGYATSENSKTVSFNGKVLKEANINLEDINCTLNFTIHITNNLNQKFAYNMALDLNLNDDNGGIYNGNLYKTINTSGNEYTFFQEIN